MPFLAPLTCSSGRSLVRPERFNFVGYPPNLAAFKNVVSGILWIKVNQVSEATFLASWRFKTAFRNAHASTITLGSASSFITDRNLASPSPSQISGPSRASSSSNLYASYSRTEPEETRGTAILQWTSLRVVGDYIFPTAPNKANSLLGAPVYGAPTVLAANGMVCVGTESGKVLVFDLSRIFVCVCGDDNSGEIHSS